MIKFKVAAKTDVGLVRTNNEDNFQISWDLSALPMRWINDEIHQLGDKGCLLIVADGMGGANAGEVASQIAIDTIKKIFIPENITDKVISSKDEINAFIKNAIILSDKNIKEYSKSHAETSGMGTTIVIAWILGDKLYVGWCGDSRAYVYNPIYGLRRVTKDHSYVQQLVDSGKLSEEEAFDFPDSNIITQCLSAAPQKCHPETLSTPYTLSNNDTILLCTDGLCGMIRDVEIESILAQSGENVSKTADSLIGAALKASGADNVTLCLLHALSGLKEATPIKRDNNRNHKPIYIAIAVLAVIIFGILVWQLCGKTKKSENEAIQDSTETVCIADSLTNESNDTIKTDSSRDNQSVSPNDGDDKISSEKVEQTEGNGKNLLNGLNTGKLPKTEDPKDGTPNTESEIEIVATPDIIVVTVPEKESLPRFMQNLGMNMNDFKKLNPGVNFNDLKKGDKIKVYKKK